MCSVTDIDAKFAKLWTFLRTRSVLTPQMYEKMMIDLFGERPNFCVEDVMVVPDYKTFLLDCVDPRFSNYAKEEQTQLAWRMESVPRSQFYPLGVRTMYRAFSTDVAFEIEEAEDNDVSDSNVVILLLFFRL